MSLIDNYNSFLSMTQETVSKEASAFISDGVGALGNEAADALGFGGFETDRNTGLQASAPQGGQVEDRQALVPAGSLSSWLPVAVAGVLAVAGAVFFFGRKGR